MKFIYNLILFNLQRIQNHDCVLIIYKKKKPVNGHYLEDVYFCETMFFVTECNAAKLHVGPDPNVIVQSAIQKKVLFAYKTFSEGVLCCNKEVLLKFSCRTKKYHPSKQQNHSFYFRKFRPGPCLLPILVMLASIRQSLG